MRNGAGHLESEESWDTLMEKCSQSTVKQKQAAEHQSVLLLLGSDCPASGALQSFLHLCGAMWSFGQWNETTENTTSGPSVTWFLVLSFLLQWPWSSPWRWQHHKMEWGCMLESSFRESCLGQLINRNINIGSCVTKKEISLVLSHWHLRVVC